MRGRTDNRWPIGLAFAAPLLAGLLLLTVYPVVSSFALSFTHAPIFGRPRWAGVANYAELGHDPRFWLSIWNTAVYGLFAVPLGMVVGLVLALLLNLKVRGMAFYRTMFFLPTVVPLVANCVLWDQLLNPDHGLANEALRAVGVPAAWLPGWPTDEAWAKPGLVLMSVWGCGGGMILYLAALQDVPADLYESASLDGAGAWRRLWHVTLPAISSVLLFTGVTGLIGATQTFAQAFVLTRGGPMNATRFYALNLFDTAFTEFRLGYASAMAWVMSAVVLAASLGVLRMSSRVVHY